MSGSIHAVNTTFFAIRAWQGTAIWLEGEVFEIAANPGKRGIINLIATT